jgi:hypothetical protein
MVHSMRALRYAAAAFVVSGGLLVASCGGGSVSSTPVAAPGATSAPVTQSIPASGGALTVNSTSAQVATLNFAAGAPGNVTLSATSSTSAPGSAPVPSAVKRAAQSISGAVPFFFVTFSVSANLSTQFFSDESVSLSSGDPSTATYFVEFDDITAAPALKLGTGGPATIAAGIATYASGGGTASTLQSGHTYLIQFYYVPVSATSAPSASPTATAAPSPSPTATAFAFSGGTGSASCSSAACGVPVGITDSPITFAATFAAPSVTTSITGSVASGSAQISPSAPFPLFSAPGTPSVAVLYMQLSATPAATFPMTPAFSLTGLTSEGSCRFYEYVSSAWTAITNAAIVSGGSSVTIPATPVAGISLSPAPLYGAIVCTPA